MFQYIIYGILLITVAVVIHFYYRYKLKGIVVRLAGKLEKGEGTSFQFISKEPLISDDVFKSFDNVINNISETKLTRVPEQKTEAVKTDLKQRFDNLQIVNELGQIVTSSLKLEDTFQHLYHTINSIMDAAVFELGIYSWRENGRSIISNLKQDETYRNHIAEWSLKNNREVLLDDAVKNFERYVPQPLVMPDGSKPVSIISFPILRQDKEVGTITVMSYKPAAFNDYHIEMIRSLIPYTAVAIGNALIHQELINTQAQLIHNEKMASLGQIASGIAHEILNPLNFVNNFSQLSLELVPELDSVETKEEQTSLKSQLISNLDKIHLHGQRAYLIVKNMMTLGRTSGGQETSIEVNRSIDEYLEISLNSFRNKSNNFECTVEKSLDPAVPAINFVSEDFGRVMLNIFNNAFYTMNEKIRKSRDSNAGKYSPELKLKTTLIGSQLIISVKDNGMGIPDEIKNKIFLPFFTTKPTGEGTGLGLSLSHDIITKGHKGQLIVDSETGKGSEFLIKLPLNAVI